LKELPSVIKNSIEAYIGCLSGAAMRSEYIETIEVAGFQEVSILEETTFPIKFMLNDPTANAIVQSLRIPLQDLNEVAESVVSIKVRALKP